MKRGFLNLDFRGMTGPSGLRAMDFIDRFILGQDEAASHAHCSPHFRLIYFLSLSKFGDSIEEALA